MKIKVILVLCTRFFQKPGTLSNPNIFEWFKFIYNTFEGLQFFGENDFFLKSRFFFSADIHPVLRTFHCIFIERTFFSFWYFWTNLNEIFYSVRLVQYWLNNLGWNIRDYLCWIVIMVCGFFIFWRYKYF